MLDGAPFPLDTPNQLDHNRLTSLINSISDGFLAVDSHGRIELSNGVALNILDTNSLDAKSISQALPLLDSAGSSVDPMSLIDKTSASLSSRDYSIKYRDGSIINLQINISCVKATFGSDQKNGYVVLFSDITKEKTAQDERDEFISVASHELRNPVAIAEGSLSNAILLAGRAGAGENVMQVMRSAHDQILFLASLINDLAMVSRADRVKLEETAEEFDPMDIMNALKTDYTAQARKKGLELVVKPAELPRIYGSRLYTREILQNFITNAIKYTEKGSIMISGTGDDSGVHLSVSDSGIGIDTEVQNKLFSKFYRSQDSRVQRISGTGLGLYVSRKLAKLMNGSIAMESELNCGSTFTLNLPISINTNGAKTVAL
jgi:two-component system, OmpR family, phosphate regulon sensor histidine kinase PhoR